MQARCSKYYETYVFTVAFETRCRTKTQKYKRPLCYVSENMVNSKIKETSCTVIATTTGVFCNSALGVYLVYLKFPVINTTNDHSEYFANVYCLNFGRKPRDFFHQYPKHSKGQEGTGRVWWWDNYIIMYFIWSRFDSHKVALVHHDVSMHVICHHESWMNICKIYLIVQPTFLAPLCHLAAELFKCRLVRRRRRRRQL